MKFKYMLSKNKNIILEQRHTGGINLRLRGCLVKCGWWQGGNSDENHFKLLGMINMKKWKYKYAHFDRLWERSKRKATEVRHSS